MLNKICKNYNNIVINKIFKKGELIFHWKTKRIIYHWNFKNKYKTVGILTNSIVFNITFGKNVAKLLKMTNLDTVLSLLKNVFYFFQQFL